MSGDLLVQVLPYFVAIVAPLLVAAQLNRSRRADKEQDWKRQDDVAAEAVKVATAANTAAQLLVKNQTDVAAQAVKDRETAAASQAETAAKLDKIQEVGEVTHSLVNSNYTASLQNELAGLKREMALLASAPNSDANQSAITTAEARIVDLEKLLVERDDQQKEKVAETASRVSGIADSLTDPNPGESA